MLSGVMSLWATDVTLHFQVIRAFTWPFHAGSLVRGILGRALHGRPSYEAWFAPRVQGEHPFLKKGSAAPPAMIPVLGPPQQQPLQVGQALAVRLRLFGEPMAKELLEQDPA